MNSEAAVGLCQLECVCDEGAIVLPGLPSGCAVRMHEDTSTVSSGNSLSCTVGYDVGIVECFLHTS